MRNHQKLFSTTFATTASFKPAQNTRYLEPKKMEFDDQMSNMTSSVETMPRVNASMLQNWRGQEVSIVGKYLGADSTDPSMHRFQGPDDQTFRVKVGANGHFNGYNSEYVEIRGTVMDGATIQQHGHQEWGNDFALSTWNKFVMLTHQFPNLF